MNRPIVPLRYVRLLLEVAGLGEEQGSDLLLTVQISAEMQADPANLITRTQYYQIVRECCRLCPDPMLGMQLGLREDIRRMGLFGYMVHACASLAEAIRLAVKYSDLVGPSFRYQFFSLKEEYVLIAHNVFDLSRTNLRFALEEWMGFNRGFISTMSGSRASPERVELTIKPTNSAAEYARIMGCPVVFEQATNRICLRRDICDRPLDTADDMAREALEQQCKRLMTQLQSGDHLSDQIRSMLLIAPGRMPDLQSVSAKLGIHPRTLRRRLATENTSFQSILNDVLKELAREYLNKSNLSVEEISHLLGYTESTNFRRAFIRWTGISPSEYRRSGSP